MTDRTPREQTAIFVATAAALAVAALPIVAVVAGASWRLFTWLAGI